jgi:hypothetical protein
LVLSYRRKDVTKYKAKIGESVINNSYYPEHIKKCVGKEIFVRDGVHGMYFGCLPKDNTKNEYCFGYVDLVDLLEITDEVYPNEKI